jgi:hypothetical protein
MKLNHIIKCTPFFLHHVLMKNHNKPQLSATRVLVAYTLCEVRRSNSNQGQSLSHLLSVGAQLGSP